MYYELNSDIKKIIHEQVSVFSFDHQKNSIIKDSHALSKWLDLNAHAQMKFLENNLEARKNPDLILSGVKTAFIFLFPYSYGKNVRVRLGSAASLDQDLNPGSLVADKLISKYVYGKDYHKILKFKLNEYAEKLKILLNVKFDYRACVDSIPFFDRAHAREAQLGFIGKNTMLIRPGMGSFFFIATLLTSLPVEKCAQKISKKNHFVNLDCGTCTKCIDACPTGALEANYFLNANKCLSYLSIEHRDIVENKYLPFFKDTIYGCDICQDVCPYNLVTTDFPIISQFAQYHKPFTIITVEQITEMTKSQYEQWFGGTAATRAKYEGLIRNALYHLFATKNKNIKQICQKLIYSQSKLIQKTVQQILESVS